MQCDSGKGGEGRRRAALFGAGDGVSRHQVDVGREAAVPLADHLGLDAAGVVSTAPP
jgi:hypothetical protein